MLSLPVNDDWQAKMMPAPDGDYVEYSEVQREKLALLDEVIGAIEFNTIDDMDVIRAVNIKEFIEGLKQRIQGECQRDDQQSEEE